MSIVANQVQKVLGEPPNHVLKDINLKIETGEFVALTGKSGSGKSTLLYLLSTLDDVSGGTISISGRNVTHMSEDELYAFRNSTMGFVFQFHYLISELTALENVLLPCRKLKLESKKEKYAKELLSEFELGGKTNRLPRQLSGGEQQRVAIARALIMDPQYLFADEPTGSLDSQNADKVISILNRINENRGTTIVLVTHDPDFARESKRQIYLHDGRIVDHL